MAAVILTKVAVAAGATSAFTNTSAVSLISIGCDQKHFKVIYRLGSDIEYEEVAVRKGDRGVVLSKASFVAIKNTSSTDSLNAEIWA